MGEKEHPKRISERLISGEQVGCPHCGNQYLKPYNTTFDKAHSFYCEKCEYRVNLDTIIDIE